MPITTTGLAVIAYYVAAPGFFVIGMLLLGYGERRDVGIHATLVGVFQFATVVLALLVGDAELALNIAVFNYIWLAAGLVFWFGEGTDITLANHLIFPAMAFFILGAKYIVVDGTLYFGLSQWSYTVVLVMVTLANYGRLNPRIPGWTLNVLAFVTVFFPTWMFLYNIPMP